MSVVNITNIQVLDNPTRLGNPFQFEITFECIAALQNDLEWKIVYVGSAEDETYDQVLDCIMVGPVPVGINKFVFQADAPKLDQIPLEDLLGVTVVLITCSYNDAEFVRVGYYVNNEYDCEEMRAEPPAVVQVDRILRTILADKPRVTRFPIKWDNILDETAKKPEDEAIDRDADTFQPAFTERPAQEDEAEEEADEEDEDDGEEDSAMEEEEDDDDDDDDFTSQLGPEEQDRMSMMIDEEDDDHEMRAAASAFAGAENHQPASGNTFGMQQHAAAFKPSPLQMHTDEDQSSMMMMMM